MIQNRVEASWRAGGPIAGSNFWAWNGEARAAHGDHRFRDGDRAYMGDPPHEPQGWYGLRSEEHTSELQSLMRISYAVFCLKKKKTIEATTNRKWKHQLEKYA